MASILDWMVRNETKFQLNLGTGEGNPLKNDTNQDSNLHFTEETSQTNQTKGSPGKTAAHDKISHSISAGTLDRYITPPADSLKLGDNDKTPGRISKLFQGGFTPFDFRRITRQTLGDLA